MKMVSNKAFEAIGAKARLSLNANVRQLIYKMFS